MNLPKISVITPSYNSGSYIEKTIQSVMGQGYPDLEYIILDGGSSDNSREIIQNYAKKSKQIKTVFRPDKGQWDAVNNGFHMATGKLLGFLNSDDVYENKSLFKLAEGYNRQPDKLWFAGSGRMINDSGKITQEIFSMYKNTLLQANNKYLLQIVNYLMQPSVFISKKAYSQTGEFIGQGKYILEYDYWLRLSNIQMPVVIPHNLSFFRLTSGMASLNFTKSILEADQNIAAKYSNNPIVLLLHRAHNSARYFIANI